MLSSFGAARLTGFAPMIRGYDVKYLLKWMIIVLRGLLRQTVCQAEKSMGPSAIIHHEPRYSQ